MAVDLLNLEPTKISRDLKGKYMLFYGLPKTGKTSLAVRFPKSLLLAFEKGYNALANVMKYDIPNWRTMKEVLRELRKPDIQEKFDSVIIDTASIAWEKCADYICAQHGVAELGDVAWGKGFSACKKEFQKTLQEISMLGYGIVFLAHAEEKIPMGGKEEDMYIAPNLDKRPYSIINGMVDIIACIDIDKETRERFLQMRSTPAIFAGSRFKYMPERIPLSYENLVNALGEAIEKEGEANGGRIVDERVDLKEEKERSFEECMDEARELWTVIQDKDPSDAMIDKLLKIVENNFGQKIKLSTVSPEQQDLLELTILDLRDLKNSL